jgi:hypothetical protein
VEIFDGADGMPPTEGSGPAREDPSSEPGAAGAGEEVPPAASVAS